MDAWNVRGSLVFLQHSLKSFLHNGKAKFFVLVLLSLLSFALLAHRLSFFDDFYTRYAPAPAPATPGPQLGKHQPSGWWIEFFGRLESTRIALPPLKLRGRSLNWKPDVDGTRLDRLDLTEEDEAILRKSHASFISQLAVFASHLPYRAGTTGIVTTAGERNFGQVISLVLMARRAGSRLPIEIILDSSSPWVDLVCSETMPRLNATCVSLPEKWTGIDLPEGKLMRFQWKYLSIIASTFQNVLFLDADCLLVRNPDPIFDLGSEPFTSTGFITWPDFWASTTAPRFYRIAGDLEIPSVTSRATSESGMMVYDKSRHADTLLLAAYYNYNGPKHYYVMLCQHGAGEGDKETYFHAALVLEGLRARGVYKQPTVWMKPGVGVKKGYYDVKKMPRSHGRTVDGKWRGMFMIQVDPMVDYEGVMGAVAAKKNEVHANPEPKKRQPSGGAELARAQRGAAAVDEEDFITDSSFLGTVGNLTWEKFDHRIMFLHHNGVKPDFTHVLDEKSGFVAKNEKGKYVRLWGDPGWLRDTFDRDVEKDLWEDSMRVYCQTKLEKLERIREVCARMGLLYAKVYL
ncbi:mannosyltransferase putative-domain-containing protein [Chaetomium tenue]|uniref:Mannosyltransferase putative-domain-containing protein n=1 Tax=Chaetomium tenue TaxID=1854479 RepID=A0ACB7P1Z6_9PEZI|nr:mannosyltransferase putative-domain-containing protein [Chaetomium globosum]